MVWEPPARASTTALRSDELGNQLVAFLCASLVCRFLEIRYIASLFMRIHHVRVYGAPDLVKLRNNQFMQSP